MCGYRKLIYFGGICVIVLVGIIAAYRVWFEPTHILVVNPLPAQAAEMVLNNDSKSIKVTCREMQEAADFDKYDAVLMYGRGLYLDSIQLESLGRAVEAGVPVFTNALRNFSYIINENVDSGQMQQLQAYFANPCRANYKNMLRYVRSFATPHRIGDKEYDDPVRLPENLFYHLDGGRYFEDADDLTAYLRETGIYNEDGDNVAFVSGVTFPVESNRAHVDTLLSRLTVVGYNVYPICGSGDSRAAMIKMVNPAAIIFLPMGRLGNDSLIDWAYDRGIPLFTPFPLIQSRSDWLDKNKPMGGGTLNARIVVPEIDGGMSPLCISTQNANDDGYMLYTPESERIDAFMEQFERFMSLRKSDNSYKKVAVAYFKSPGKDALLASGMEVVPSLYNFLLRLRREGYDVSGLPANVDEFKRKLMENGAVMGDYAAAAQERFMEEANPLWINKNIYENWAKEVLLPEKYAEVVARYGEAPGVQLVRGDSIAVAALRYGNVLVFPQPRPALGDDDFKLVHGVDVAPPHSYIAPYLYMQKAFDADVMIHFGTHGNLEFTPGKNAGLSQADWAEVLVGNRPHFYFYTTGNVGEAIIAKRRSHAVIVTHLTPPYVESGLRQKYSALIEDLHRAIANPATNDAKLKETIKSLGFHRDLCLDSMGGVYSIDELKKVDAFVEELANEKITGAYYTMGEAYSDEDMMSTVLAIMADKLAYDMAKKDFEDGLIDKEELQDFAFVSHHYLSGAKNGIKKALKYGDNSMSPELISAVECRRLLIESAGAELDAMVGALDGVPVRPAPGGDLVLNPNVLPMGRNMYSINAETTPGPKAWEAGVALAEQTLKNYKMKHGEYPHKVGYTFWAGEFISSQGATVAQALRMLGVEPVRDGQGRVMDLKLIPSEELGRPRINIMVQVSGQLRDIASSRLKMITNAVKLASEAEDDIYPNYVSEGTVEQERALVEKGESPQRARELSTMRVFGPVNSGYSTGMLRYTESSGEWDDRQELVDGYLNNMCAMYGDDDNWGNMNQKVLGAAITNTDVVVQPRQSNTWGPISLDHLYEFTGALSLVSKYVNGKEPEAVLADYRNPYLPRVQDLKEGIAVETRATILNPEFIKERMKGDATTAQMFGEIFRNIFGWSVMRQSALTDNVYDDLFDIYVADKYELGIENYFNRVNPAALQEMTATMLESARKGFWKTDREKIEVTAELHTKLAERNGVPCTEFVCGNAKLGEFTACHLNTDNAEKYRGELAKATATPDDAKILRERQINTLSMPKHFSENDLTIAVSIVALGLMAAMLMFLNRRRRRK